MTALDLGQWAAVGVIVAQHSPNPELKAAVDAELAEARRCHTDDPVPIGDVLPDVLNELARRRAD